MYNVFFFSWKHYNVSKMTCFNWHSQTSASGIWNWEVVDHDDYYGWPCICGHPHWGTPNNWAMQWIYHKLWHYCIQQNLSFLGLLLTLLIVWTLCCKISSLIIKHLCRLIVLCLCFFIVSFLLFLRENWRN